METMILAGILLGVFIIAGVIAYFQFQSRKNPDQPSVPPKPTRHTHRNISIIDRNFYKNGNRYRPIILASQSAAYWDYDEWDGSKWINESDVVSTINSANRGGNGFGYHLGYTKASVPECIYQVQKFCDFLDRSVISQMLFVNSSTGEFQNTMFVDSGRIEAALHAEANSFLSVGDIIDFIILSHDWNSKYMSQFASKQAINTIRQFSPAFVGTGSRDGNDVNLDTDFNYVITNLNDNSPYGTNSKKVEDSIYRSKNENKPLFVMLGFDGPNVSRSNSLRKFFVEASKDNIAGVVIHGHEDARNEQNRLVGLGDSGYGLVANQNDYDASLNLLNAWKNFEI